jgi:restriction system protein
MAVGSQFAQYINPLLAVLKSLGGSARSAEAKAAVAEHLQLSDEVLEEQLASGSSRFDNQVSWARYYLVRAGYIDSSRRGVWSLTEKGRNVAVLSDEEINKLVQDVISEWGSRPKQAAEPKDEVPEPFSDEASGDHRSQLLALLKELPPAGFERLCQRLLREAGFEQVTVTGRSGDGGIDGDGILELNSFVSFKVLFQCKRYKESVGPSVVRDFRGAMMGRADKGLILTTGSYSAESRREAVRDGVPPIELVDGDKLVELFEQLELGLEPRTTYAVVDSFFAEFRDDAI